MTKGEQVEIVGGSDSAGPLASNEPNAYSGSRLFSGPRLFLGRLSGPAVIAIMTGTVLVEAIVLQQIAWWIWEGGDLPLALAAQITVVNFLVATPVIAYSQDVIHLLRASRRALRTLTQELADARDMLERTVEFRTAELSAANDAHLRTIAELRMARDEAQAANAAKSQFLANMSHELRTPLNAVIGFSEVIRDEVFGPGAIARYRDYAGDIHSSGEHLLHIIGDVLDMSKIEADRLILHEEETDIALTVNTALKLVRQAAAQQGVTLSVDLPRDLPMLLADCTRVKQVLLNLLSNAIKFSNPSGAVAVGAAVRPDGSLAIWVSDSGIGMSDAEIEVALQPFRQIETPHIRRHDGTGLGLPLTRGLMQLHGGSLILTSIPQIGTTATVTFPPTRVLTQNLTPTCGSW